MNNSTLLHNPFSVDYPVTTDTDYSHRSFTNSSGFSMDEDDHNRRVNTLGHPLAQPVSIPVSNGLRYNAQTTSMHDVSFATSPTMLMSPGDSCSEAFSSTSYSPTPNSLYTPSSSLSYDRMSNFGSHRMPPLQSPASQIPGTWRTDNFSGSYALPRSHYHQLSTYTNSPRAFDNTVDRHSGLMMPQANLFVDPMQRFSPAEAPPWNSETNILLPVWSGSIAGGQTIKPEIQASIPSKRIFLDEEKWTCYRRNYLAVTCSFSLHPYSTGPFWVKTKDRGTQQIQSFAMGLSAIVDSNYEETRELVQHSPKRDKKSERTPGKITLHPCQPPAIGLGHGSAASNGAQHSYAMASQSAGLYDYNSPPYANATQSSHTQTQCTFERIQFAKATANNGKRRATQQFYNLVVDLFARIDPPVGGEPNDEWVKIARRLSHPMVVRGRSPGHYQNHRRDSQTSMDPEGSAGGPGEYGGMLPPGSRGRFSMMPYDSASSQRYGRTDYHQHIKPEQSPLSNHSPHTSSSSSSCTLDMGILNDHMEPMDTIKPTSSTGSYDNNTFAMADLSLDQKVNVTESGDSSDVANAFRHPLPSFEYDTLTKEESVNATGVSTFPDTVASMVAMMPNEHGGDTFIRNPPRVPSQSASNGGFNAMYGDSSFGRFDSVQNSQELCT